jgi:serine/threonine protein phosphatase 1
MQTAMPENTYIDERAYERIIAVGDIHGYPAPAGEIIAKIDPKSADLVIFIGDYIDRGPDARQVVDELIQLKNRHGHTMFLKGNHEDMMLGAMGQDALVRDVNTWLYNGGHTTLASYGLGREEIRHLQTSREPDARFRMIREFVPDAHIDFYLGLQLFIESDAFFFCHAGVSPYGTVAEGRENLQDLLWIREHLYAPDPPWEKTVVCGHTPLREVLMTDRLICIDTGLYYYGELSATDVLTRELYSVRMQS